MWRADLVRTRTGQVGAHLDVTSTGQGPQDQTNGIPAGQVTLSRAQLSRIPREWWEPWRTGIVLAHRHRDTDQWTPILGGPITGYSSIGEHSITAAFEGIQTVLQHRMLVHEWSQFETTEAWRKGFHSWALPRGQIAWEVLEDSMAKPYGGLPIVHGTPDELVTVPERRTYPNWDMANLNIWDKVLHDMAQEDGGPDLRFIPRYAAGGQRRIEWVFEHGTLHDPWIAHPYTLRIDSTAARSPATNVDVAISARPVAHRVYGTGAGEGAGTWVLAAEDFTSMHDEMPLLESVASDTSLSGDGPVVALAQSRLAPDPWGAWSLKCDLHTSPSLPLWQVRPGAPVQIKVANRAPFPDGWHRGRILSCGYSLSSDVVQVEVEEER